MMYDFVLLLNLVVILYVWMDTDAVIEWAQLFHLKFFNYEGYHKVRNGPLSQMVITYCDFLEYEYGNKFLIKLITCPICLSVWLNIGLLCVFYSKIGWAMLGPNIILSWLLYHALKKMLQELNA